MKTLRAYFQHWQSLSNQILDICGETAKPDGTTENAVEYIYFGEYPQTLKADGDGALKDKVLLLSKTQALALDADAKRMKNASDYAIENGAWISTSDGYYRNAIWLLRSPAEDSDSFVCYCDQYGEVNNGGTLLSSNFFGVSPAIKIKL